MIKKIAIFGVLGVGLLSAKTFNFTVTSPTTAGSSQLKPGDYKLKVDGSQAVLMDRKGNTLDTGKVEPADHKFNQTSISSSTASGANKLESIEFAGSNTKVVFE
jgi:hypothetical protein